MGDRTGRVIENVIHSMTGNAVKKPLQGSSKPYKRRVRVKCEVRFNCILPH